MNPAHEMGYDAEADALYIHFARDFIGAVTTIPSVDERVQVDVVDGKVVGIEVLGVKTHPGFMALIPQVQGMELVRFAASSTATTSEPVEEEA